MDVKEMVKFMENLGYEVIRKKVDIVDKLLGKICSGGRRKKLALNC